MEHRVLDHRGRVVTVDGELIASVSSRYPEFKARWTDLTLYRLTHGGFLLSVVGRSALPGESDRPSVKVAENEAALLRALTDGATSYGRLSRLACQLLDQAGIPHP